jgi:hypothetical protein
MSDDNHPVRTVGTVTLTDAESLKRMWTRIFARSGADGTYTRVFERLDPAQQSFLLNRIELHDAELPVLGSAQGVDTWLILTTDRLVWAIDGVCHELAASLIWGAKPDLLALRAAGESMLTMRQLRVQTMSGEEYVIELEPGAPMSGTWNVLLNLAGRNLRKRS